MDNSQETCEEFLDRMSKTYTGAIHLSIFISKLPEHISVDCLKGFLLSEKVGGLTLITYNSFGTARKT